MLLQGSKIALHGKSYTAAKTEKDRSALMFADLFLQSDPPEFFHRGHHAWPSEWLLLCSCQLWLHELPLRILAVAFFASRETIFVQGGGIVLCLGVCTPI